MKRPLGILSPKKLASRPALTRRQFLERGSAAILPLASSMIGGCSANNFFSAPKVQSSPTPALVNPFNEDQISFGLNHYLVTGQSLSTGEQGFFGLSNNQPFSNVMLGTGSTFAYATIGEPSVVFSPLISAAAGVETIGNGLADSLTARARAILRNFPGGPTSYNSLVSCSGVPGFNYQRLCGPTDWNDSNPYWASAGGGTAGSPPFQEMMSQVMWGMKLAAQLGVSYRVAAMILIHGEFDSTNPAYPTNLQTWQSDMQNGITALTGQGGIIPLIGAQTQSFYSTASFDISGCFGLYEAALANPTKIFVGCAEYACQHHLANETGPTASLTIHMTADGYRHLGEMMSKAAQAITMEGQQWLSLRAIGHNLSGNQITIEHSVPYAPLVLDTDWVSDPGNFGFSYNDNTDLTVMIISVAVTGPTEVTLTLNKPSVGGTLGYADFAPPSDPSYLAAGTTDGLTTDYGPKFGPRGCLRDSDPAVAYYQPSAPYYVPSSGSPNQYPMQNYCTQYRVRVGSCIGAEQTASEAAWRC